MAKLSPLFNEATFDANGDPAVGYKVYTYTAGSTTPQSTYTDATGTTPQANPIVLNSRGEPDSPIWLSDGVSYKFILKTDADVTVRTIDGISGVNDVSAPTQDQWTAGPAPTYVGATSFTLVGDQTSTFHVGRRLKSTNSGGTVYSTITATSYSNPNTTVTVRNDSGTLDSGLSAVSYAVLSSSDSATPPHASVVTTAVRALNAATGDASYTGAGFRPRMVTFTAAINGTRIATIRGVATATAQGCVYDSQASGGTYGTSSSSCMILDEETGVKAQSAVWKSFDSDGVTLTWTRTGSTSSGNIDILIEYHR